MNNFFIADTHFGHANIILYCGRPWLRKKDLDFEGNWMSREIAKRRCDEMDKELIRRINGRVRSEDTMFFVGDFCLKKSKEAPEGNIFKYYRDQINCKNIIFIKGNHDENNSTKTIVESLVIRYGGKWIKLVHRPEPQYIDTRYDMMFVGHVHGLWKFKRARQGCSFVDLVNVGVDVWNFYPITFNEIMKTYNRWRKEQ